MKKIIIYVDFSSEDFNKDFKLSQELAVDNTVLMVTNLEQLHSSIGAYDLVLIGFSSASKLENVSKPVFDLKVTEQYNKALDILKG